MNITEVTELLNASMPQVNSRHQIAILGQISILAKTIDFDPLKGCFLKTRLK